MEIIKKNKDFEVFRFVEGDCNKYYSYNIKALNICAHMLLLEAKQRIKGYSKFIGSKWLNTNDPEFVNSFIQDYVKTEKF